MNRPAAPSVKAADVYHHGDLRTALVGAAREALETASPDTITLKSLAIRLGVSQPAPYRHFENRDALLAAVAADGFERFRAELIRAHETAPEAEKFERACLAYLAFGQANPGVYRLMFASRLMPTSDDAALGRAGDAAFDFLLQGVSGYVPPERIHAVAIWVWSTLHGLVMLEAEGLLSGPVEKAVPAAQVVREMVRGLAAARQEPARQARRKAAPTRPAR